MKTRLKLPMEFDAKKKRVLLHEVRLPNFPQMPMSERT